MFEICHIDELVASIIEDIRNFESLKQAVQQAAPNIIIHMAAQPIVRESYKNPVETYAVNVMGTVNLLEAVRQVPGIKAVVNVTTDKCYENREWVWGYREDETLGGYDPYSSSKACSELVTTAYRRSFFTGLPRENLRTAFPPPSIASARAGNVIGGGDWGKDRFIPDCIRALTAGQKVQIRNLSAIRPWQHVLEPLGGYLVLAERLYNTGSTFAEAWNFGPDNEDARPVQWILERLAAALPGFGWECEEEQQPHEAECLKLDISKSRSRLQWHPQWGLETAVDRTIEWYMAWRRGEDMREATMAQISSYERQLKTSEAK